MKKNNNKKIKNIKMKKNLPIFKISIDDMYAEDGQSALVYRHRRLDTNEIFYVGISVKKDRPYHKSGRNKFWKNIVNKTPYEVEIIATNLSWDDACELEIF